jgi:hypothetical protein
LNFLKLGNRLVIQFSEISVRPKNPCIFKTLIGGEGGRRFCELMACDFNAPYNLFLGNGNKVI